MNVAFGLGFEKVGFEKVSDTNGVVHGVFAFWGPWIGHTAQHLGTQSFAFLNFKLFSRVQALCLWRDPTDH